MPDDLHRCQPRGRVLARNHRLVLQYNPDPWTPSGLTDPKLHIFGPYGTDIAVTDGTTFSLSSGPQYPASDPAAAAALIGRGSMRHPHALTGTEPQVGRRSDPSLMAALVRS